jgi:thiol:disulfide interchange protein DsbD
MAVMLAVGLGLALPFLVLTFVPAWTRWLPRPGAWMSRLKQGLAFPLYATVLWLLWVAGQQIGIDGMARVLSGLLLLALAIWLFSVWRHDQGGSRMAAIGCAIAAAIGSTFVAVTSVRAPEAPIRVADSVSVPFAEGEIPAIRASGRAVFVNMTAAWCITCLVNERVALDTEAVRDALAARSIVYMKGDWTNRDAAISSYLASFGRAGVPLYVLYPPGDGAPRVLPQILTESSLLDALDELGDDGESI